jgi:hypothetical protein
MNCPKCGYPRPDGAPECSKCGIIFTKYRGAKGRQDGAGRGPSWTDSLEVDGPAEAGAGPRALGPEVIYHAHQAGLEGWEYYKEFTREFLLREEGEPGEAVRYGRMALLLMMALAAAKFISTPIPDLTETLPFLHLVNLPFHEAGHIVFTPFGRFLQVLGGSLAQELVPLICLGAFLLTKRDPFAAAVAWWWAGENLVDLAPYINDARAGDMTLIGGITGREDPDFHDWKNLLTWTHLLKFDHAIARMAFCLGMAMMVSALAWGIIVIRRGQKAGKA